MLARIGESLIGSLLVALCSYIFALAFTYYFDSSSIVTIGESTQIEESQFILPVNITAYEDLKNLRLRVPNSMTEKQIKSNAPINIKSVENNVGTTVATVFEIERLSSDSNAELILVTSKPLNEAKIVIDDNGNNVDVKYINKVENPIQTQNKGIIINAIVYVIIFGTFLLVSNTFRDKKIRAYQEDRDAKIKEVNEKHAELKESAKEQKELSEKVAEESRVANEKMRADLNNFEEKLIKAKEDSIKKQILLLAKLNDYRRELSFWRDTIRKVLHQTSNGKKNAEQLIEVVTSSLKTYQTNEKQHDFETLKVLAKMIKDIDEDEEVEK